jgi:hypothetical protein
MNLSSLTSQAISDESILSAYRWIKLIQATKIKEIKSISINQE